MEFLVLRWQGRFIAQGIILFRKATIVHIFILHQSPHKISQREGHFIKNESKKLLEKWDLQCQNAETLLSSHGRHVVHAKPR